MEHLGPAEQRKVLDFARALRKRSPSDPTRRGILRSVGVFDPADLATMATAIEESCERIDRDEW